MASRNLRQSLELGAAASCDNAAFRAVSLRSNEIVERFDMADLISRITMDPAICHGKPVVRGLRYPVETVLEWLSTGMTADEILSDYPDLEADDLRAVLAYAARLSRVERIEPLAA